MQCMLAIYSFFLCACLIISKIIFASFFKFDLLFTTYLYFPFYCLRLDSYFSYCSYYFYFYLLLPLIYYYNLYLLTETCSSLFTHTVRGNSLSTTIVCLAFFQFGVSFIVDAAFESEFFI